MFVKEKGFHQSCGHIRRLMTDMQTKTRYRAGVTFGASHFQFLGNGLVRVIVPG